MKEIEFIDLIELLISDLDRNEISFVYNFINWLIIKIMDDKELEKYRFYVLFQMNIIWKNIFQNDNSILKIIEYLKGVRNNSIEDLFNIKSLNKNFLNKIHINNKKDEFSFRSILYIIKSIELMNTQMPILNQKFFDLILSADINYVISNNPFLYNNNDRSSYVVFDINIKYYQFVYNLLFGKELPKDLYVPKYKIIQTGDENVYEGIIECKNDLYGLKFIQEIIKKSSNDFKIGKFLIIGISLFIKVNGKYDMLIAHFYNKDGTKIENIDKLKRHLNL